MASSRWPWSESQKVRKLKLPGNRGRAIHMYTVLMFYLSDTVDLTCLLGGLHESKDVFEMV